jgi:hypothetical protein
MTYSKPARAEDRPPAAIILAAVLIVGAALVGVAASRGDLLQDEPAPTVATTPGVTGVQVGRAIDEPSRVRGGATVFDDTDPAVANLDQALLGALRDAASDAAGDKVAFHVNSGWRSAEHQEQLLRDAISEYGSEAEAARWVATPEKSAHVSGDAVDIGPSEAAKWLSEHGADYGLCQTYVNEPWHYELRPDATDHGCPPMYADPTHDPRMQ